MSGLINLDVTEDRWLRAAAKTASLPLGLEKAMARSLNKTVLGMRTDASRMVRQEYAVPVRDALGLVFIRKAYQGYLQAEMKCQSSANISLGHFGPRPVRVKSAGGKRQGVSVMVKRSSGRKRLGQGFQPKPGGPIFARDGQDRLPIHKLFTSAPVRFLERPDSQARLLAQGEARLAKNFAHESAWILEQAGLK